MVKTADAPPKDHTRALIAKAKGLGMSQADIGRVLGVDNDIVSKMFRAPWRRLKADEIPKLNKAIAEREPPANAPSNLPQTAMMAVHLPLARDLVPKVRGALESLNLPVPAGAQLETLVQLVLNSLSQQEPVPRRPRAAAQSAHEPPPQVRARNSQRPAQ